MRATCCSCGTFVKRLNDPASHLKPILLRPVFPVQQQVQRKDHPYSLGEFPADPIEPRLKGLKQRLVATDLSYRLRVAAHERRSQNFWAAINARYAADKAQEADDDDTFNARWLAANKQKYKAYHARFYREQFALLWPASKLYLLKLKWKWNCWRLGASPGLDD